MEVNYFTVLYWFCHTSTWIRHRYTCVPHPEPLSFLPPRTIPLVHPSAPAPSIQYHASNLDWWFILYMILYMFQCHSPKSSYPLPLPQSPKDCSIHLCFSKKQCHWDFYSEPINQLGEIAILTILKTLNFLTCEDGL